MLRSLLMGREGDPSIWRDLKTGRLGWPLRLGLSLATGAALLGLGLFMLGLAEASGGRVHDEHVAMVLGLSGAMWCAALVVVWWTYGRWQVFLKTFFGLLAIWMLVIPMAVVLDGALRGRGEFLMGAIIVLGIAASLMVVTVVPYRYAGRRHTPLDPLEVRCPECGYSMVGLCDCRCPECGHQDTIDGLLADQNRLTAGGRLPEAPHVGLDGPPGLPDDVARQPV